MSHRTWMAFYTADFLAKTQHLCPMQIGAYTLLIIHYWNHDGLPSNACQLARIARLTPDQWAEHEPTLRSFFYGEWKHERIDQELEIAKEKHDKRVNAGRNGGKQRASNATSNAQALLNQPQPQPLSKSPKPKKDEFEEDPHFIEFYLSYPKKKGKRAAAKAYGQALRHVTHDEIMAGLANAKKSDHRFRDSKFTPFPASWLNSGGYADEVEIVRHSINDPYAGIE